MDDSLSPEKILFRLEELRRWQQAQEAKLLEQQEQQRKKFTEEQTKLYYEKLNISRAQIDCDVNSRISSYNKSYDENVSGLSESKIRRFDSSDLIDGVGVLNTSSESEHYMPPDPPSKHADHSLNSNLREPTTPKENILPPKPTIQLDDVPILPSTKNFETLIEDTLKETDSNTNSSGKTVSIKSSKPFLRRGQGMSRYKMSSSDIGIKNKKLPWVTQKVPPIIKHPNRISPQWEKEHHTKSDSAMPNKKVSPQKPKKKLNFALDSQIQVISGPSPKDKDMFTTKRQNIKSSRQDLEVTPSPVKSSWASIFTEDQEHYKKLLKLTNDYKKIGDSPEKNYTSNNSSFMSPAMNRIKAEKEIVEQKMFELLEKKVEDSSFSSNNNYFKVSQSGDDTPVRNRQYLEAFPFLQKLKPNLSDLQHIKGLDSSRDSLGCDTNSAYSQNYYSRDSVSRNISQNQCEGEYICSTDDATTECEEYSESTDTEETQMLLEQFISSTPNQGTDLRMQKKLQELNANKKKKLIKIVISKNNTNDSDFIVENIDHSCLEDKTLKNNENLNTETNASDSTLCDRDMMPDFVSRTELLKVRLQELEAEIAIFRKENENLNNLKGELEIEKELFYNEKAKAERKITEDKIMAEYYLVEEKEKLTKQRLLYDRQVKEMKSQSLKQDREEITLLKKELTCIKEQVANKDIKTGASLARLRNQVKNLEKENSELKVENEKIRKENKRLNTSNARTRRLSSIKSLAEINKSLAQMTSNNTMANVEIEDVYPETNISTEYLLDGKQSKKDRRSFKPKQLCNMRSRARSVPNLTATSRYAKYFSQKDEELKIPTNEHEFGLNSRSDSDNSINVDAEEYDFQSHDSRRTSSESFKMHDNEFNKSTQGSQDHLRELEHSYYNEPLKCGEFSKELQGNTVIEQIYKDKFSNPVMELPSQKFQPSTLPKSIHGSNIPEYGVDYLVQKPKPIVSEDQVEIIRPDGNKEIRFSNGNTKICSADGTYSKFKYYNGDIKETFFDEGTIKYFYKEVNTHHTTYRDGSQVLQFPDGHLEHRYKDGSVQAHLPNGATRWTKTDGSEEWSFPDGTLVIVSPDGEQTLRFPNGQTEIHALDHKRREFPDGTVKVIYADGVVETRYSNGRIRVKDKLGNLVMDSANRQNLNQPI